MRKDEKKREFRGIDLEKIKNSYELKVIDMMEKVVPEYPEYTFSQIDFEDIYALSLNNIPSKYVQPGTIVLKKDLTEEEIRFVVEESIEKVIKNPNY